MPGFGALTEMFTIQVPAGVISMPATGPDWVGRFHMTTTRHASPSWTCLPQTPTFNDAAARKKLV